MHIPHPFSDFTLLRVFARYSGIKKFDRLQPPGVASSARRCAPATRPPLRRVASVARVVVRAWSMDGCPQRRARCLRAERVMYVHADSSVSGWYAGSRLHQPIERAATQRMRGPCPVHIPRSHRVDTVRCPRLQVPNFGSRSRADSLLFSRRPRGYASIGTVRWRCAGGSGRERGRGRWCDERRPPFGSGCRRWPVLPRTPSEAPGSTRNGPATASWAVCMPTVGGSGPASGRTAAGSRVGPCARVLVRVRNRRFDGFRPKFRRFDRTVIFSGALKVMCWS